MWNSPATLYGFMSPKIRTMTTKRMTILACIAWHVKKILGMYKISVFLFFFLSVFAVCPYSILYIASSVLPLRIRTRRTFRFLHKQNMHCVLLKLLNLKLFHYLLFCFILLFTSSTPSTHVCCLSQILGRTEIWIIYSKRRKKKTESGRKKKREREWVIPIQQIW